MNQQIKKFFSIFLCKHLLLLIIFLIIIKNVNASNLDSLKNGIKLEVKSHYGFVYPHHDAIRYLLKGNIYGAEITLSTSSKGRHYWEQLYRFPNYGIGYNFNNFSNPEVLGYSHALFGFYEVPVINRDNSFSFNYKIDFGLAYITKTFDIYENPLNLAISAHFNAYIGVDLTFKQKLNNKNEIKTALELGHFSNGKIKSPNLGLNTAMLSLAWMYSLEKSIPPKRLRQSNEFKRHFTELIFNSGLKNDDMLSGKLYYTSSFIAEYSYAFSWKYGVGIGTDFFLDNSLGPTKYYEEGIPEEKGDNVQFGAHIGFRARYNRMVVFFNVGNYIIANYYKYSSIYERVGMRYSITNNILLNLSVKAHYAIADYIEWGVGYRFNSKGL